MAFLSCFKKFLIVLICFNSTNAKYLNSIFESQNASFIPHINHILKEKKTLTSRYIEYKKLEKLNPEKKPINFYLITLFEQNKIINLLDKYEITKFAKPFLNTLLKTQLQSKVHQFGTFLFREFEISQQCALCTGLFSFMPKSFEKQIMFVDGIIVGTPYNTFQFRYYENPFSKNGYYFAMFCILPFSHNFRLSLGFLSSL